MAVEVHGNTVPHDVSRDGTRDLSDLFYESVTLTERLSQYMSECRGLLQDSTFWEERDRCQEVLETQLPNTEEPPKEPEEEQPAETTTRPPGDKDTEEPSDEEELHVSENEDEDSLSDSELELSDDLTEVSSTDSLISDCSAGESVVLEIDDYNLLDCSITRRVNPPPQPPQHKPVKPMSLHRKTELFIDQVNNKVSCKCCRSVMGRITHEIRRSESLINQQRLKPYVPKTRLISNVQEAIDFQLHYEREWYAAVLIQRAWRTYSDYKMRALHVAAQVRRRGEMRLKYGHIAPFVERRERRKSCALIGGEEEVPAGQEGRVLRGHAVL